MKKTQEAATAPTITKPSAKNTPKAPTTKIVKIAHTDTTQPAIPTTNKNNISGVEWQVVQSNKKKVYSEAEKANWVYISNVRVGPGKRGWHSPEGNWRTTV